MRERKKDKMRRRESTREKIEIKIRKEREMK